MSRIVLALLLGLLAGPPVARADATGLDALRAAAETHPDDADLAWAHARALEKAGRHEEALEWLARIRGRWPERAVQCDLARGRILHARGHWAGALDALESAIEADPHLGSARLYRALSLRELGRHEAADRELAVVGEIDPELRADARLLRATRRLEVGRPGEARALLRRLIQEDPGSEPARRARELLGSGPGARSLAWLSVGGMTDSNVTLDSGTLPSTDESDTVGVLSAGLVTRLVDAGWGGLSLGYAYGETEHEELKQLDLQTHALIAALVAPGPLGTTTRLDALLLDAHLDKDRYRRSWRLRPSLVLAAPDSAWSTQLFGEVERIGYHEAPSLPSLDRDGTRYALGLAQSLPLSAWRGARGRIETSWSRMLTDASTDLLGFRGDHDMRRVELDTELRLPLGARLELTGGVRLAHERYAHTSLVDALTDEGIGTVTPGRRRDSIQEASLALAWRARPGLRVELRWDGTRQRSSVDVYDHERHRIGLYVLQQLAWPARR